MSTDGGARLTLGKRLGRLIFGASLGVIISVVALALLTLVLWLAGVYEDYIFAAVAVSSAAGSFAAGFLTAGRVEMKGIVSGFLSGIIFYLLVLLIGWLSIMKPGQLGAQTLVMLAASCAAACIGGITGANMHSRR